VPDDIADGKLGKGFLRLVRCAMHTSARRGNGEVNAGRQLARLVVGEPAKTRHLFPVMGKDNVPFHYGRLSHDHYGSGEPWKLVDRIKGFNYINYCGGKFSTAGARRVHGFGAEILPSDLWRYYLMANAPESSDSNFTWSISAATVNKDLADVSAFRQPGDEVLRHPLRFARARRRRVGR